MKKQIEKSTAHLNRSTNTSKKSTAPVPQKLRDLLKTNSMIRLLQAHDGLTGLIAQSTVVKKNGRKTEFDGIWVGSLVDAISKGKPDISVIDMTSRMHTIHEILDVTTKPLVVDAENGGLTEHFGFTVSTMERVGVSAIVIEDKVGKKRNSLFDKDHTQEQDTIKNFCKKIRYGKSKQTSRDFMIVARIESLILKKGLKDALKRAEAYIGAGADAIFIHSKSSDPAEILQFCAAYKKMKKRVPLMVAPTTYNNITETELSKAGVRMVIYANQLLRSAYPAMKRVAETILTNERSLETNEFCMPISEFLHLIPFTEAES